jgi:hypothetical protein
MNKKELVVANQQTEVVRSNIKTVEHELKQSISNFAEYVDSSGKRSSGAKGLAMQINIRVKKCFGADREGMDHVGVCTLYNTLVLVNGIINRGMENKLSRAEIKAKIYQAIEAQGEIQK